MDLYIQIIVVACLTGMTSLLAHRSAAVFHDGIRPILPNRHQREQCKSRNHRRA